MLLGELRGLLGSAIVVSRTASERTHHVHLRESVSDVVAARLLKLLRMRRGVIYAEFDLGSRRQWASSKAATSRRDTNPTIRRLIVTFSDSARAQTSRPGSSPGVDWDQALSDAAGVQVHVVRPTLGGEWVVELFTAMDVATAELLAARMQADGIARFAVPDYVFAPTLVPNDPAYLSGQQYRRTDHDNVHVVHNRQRRSAGRPAHPDSAVFRALGASLSLEPRDVRVLVIELHLPVSRCGKLPLTMRAPMWPIAPEPLQ